MGKIRAALMGLVVTTAACGAPRHTLIVRSLAHANHDRRFYLVVRALKEEEFPGDGYPRIAGLVFPAAPDPSVKLVRLIAPGGDDTVELRLPDDQPVAVYALFTEPGESWKLLLAAPLARRYRLVVDGNRLLPDAPGAAR